MDANREQVLVVDEEEELPKALVEILTLDGFEVGPSEFCGRSSREHKRDTVRDRRSRIRPYVNRMYGSLSVDTVV